MDTNTNTLSPAGQTPGVGSDGLLAYDVFFYFKAYREARERQDQQFGPL